MEYLQPWNTFYLCISLFGAVFSSQSDYNLFVSGGDVILLLKEYISPHLEIGKANTQIYAEKERKKLSAHKCEQKVSRGAS